MGTHGHFTKLFELGYVITVYSTDPSVEDQFNFWASELVKMTQLKFAANSIRGCKIWFRQQFFKQKSPAKVVWSVKYTVFKGQNSNHRRSFSILPCQKGEVSTIHRSAQRGEGVILSILGPPNNSDDVIDDVIRVTQRMEKFPNELTLFIAHRSKTFLLKR